MSVASFIFAPADSPKSALWRRRLIVALILFIIVAISAMWWEPPLTAKIRAVESRHECLNYLAPTNQVVYEEDPSAVASLATQAGYESTDGGRLRWIPECWQISMPPCVQSEGTVFLHERTSPAGHRRLVAVDLNLQPGSTIDSTGDVDDISFVQTIISPGGGFSSDKIVRQGETILWICPADPKPMRFYGGRPDPNDSSKFTFDYQRAGVRATVDGKLNDDDTITLVPRLGCLNHGRLPLLWEPDEQATTAAATQPIR